MSIIALVGIMYSGKTSIGEKLVKIVPRMKHFDTDKVIENNSPITNIFTNQGEKYFRQLEYETILQIIKKNKDCVISIGGGAFAQKQTRTLLLKKTKTIWLKINQETALIRLKQDSKSSKRPLASKLFNQVFFDNRNKVYEEADFQIECDHLTPNEIAEKILNSFSLFNPLTSQN